MPEGIRDDVLMRLVDRAMSDEDFRRRTQEDPEGTLRAERFELSGEELSAVKEFQQQVAGLSDEKLQQAIADAPGRQQAG
jgi:hypothetical protein